MEYLIGLILSLVVAGFAIIVGFDRDRSFYPTVLIIIASYYVLFAVMGASRRPADFSYLPYSASKEIFGWLSLPLLGTDVLTSCIICLSQIRGYRVDGLDSVWHLM
jgi:hypothetical protein